MHSPWIEPAYDDSSPDDVSEALADNYAFAGPGYWSGALQSLQNRLRLLSPLVNQVTRNSVALFETPTVPSRFTYSPDGDGYWLSIHHLWWRPVPPLCTRAYCRVFVQTFLAAGFPMGSTVSISFRVYSMDKLPHEAGVQYSHSATVTRTTNDTSTGLGAELDLGALAVRTGPNGLSYFALAYKVGAVTGHGFNEAKIKAISIEPLC